MPIATERSRVEVLALQDSKWDAAIAADPVARARATKEKRDEIRKAYGILFQSTDADGDAVLTVADLAARPNRAPPRPADIVSLLQIQVDLPATLTAEERLTKARDFAEATRKIDSCEAAAILARDMKSELTRVARLRLSAIPKPLRDQIILNPVGRATTVFSDKNALRVLVRCDELPVV